MLAQGQTKKHFQIHSDRLRLKPYARKYVKEYHQWFADDSELLYLTGSQPLTLEQQYQNQQTWITDPSKYTFLIFDKENRMLGDINLFFSKWIEPHQAEINIMIALRSERGKGYAKEAMNMVEAFALVYYQRSEIIAKIKDDNAASMKLFEKCGYSFVSHSESFKETQYRKKLTHGIEFYQAELKDVKEVAQEELLSQ